MPAHRFAYAAAAAALAFAPLPAGAVRVFIPTAERCALSTLVVDAEVTSQEGVWNDDLIETLVDIHVHQALKGTAPDSLTFVVPGGEVAGLHLDISEAPKLKTDHRYVLLLHKRTDGAWTPVGGPDGVFLLTERSPAAAQALAQSLGACHVR